MRDPKDKSLRYSAEKVLWISKRKMQWHQRFSCRVSRVKSWFARRLQRYNEEKKEQAVRDKEHTRILEVFKMSIGKGCSTRRRGCWHSSWQWCSNRYRRDHRTNCVNHRAKHCCCQHGRRWCFWLWAKCRATLQGHQPWWISLDWSCLSRSKCTRTQRHYGSFGSCHVGTRTLDGHHGGLLGLTHT